VAGHIFQARQVWIYTQSNITKHSYSINQLINCISGVQKQFLKYITSLYITLKIFKLF
jgi:hypothetical protein